MLLYPLSEPCHFDSGYCYTTPAPNVPKLLPSWRAFLFENDRAIGSGESLHAEIREGGAGKFSLSNDWLYFSASDNSDPRENGRRYSLLTADLSSEAELGSILRGVLAADDLAIMSLVLSNASINNAVFSNFFRYSNTIMTPLRRNCIALPPSILEVGCGAQPYTALRFLADGAERYIANEIGAVADSFDMRLIDLLAGCVDVFDCSLGARLRDRLRRVGDRYVASGLTVIAHTPCESIQLDDPVAFITSTSVLEHVQKPREVVQAFNRLLAPSGVMWHSIDLRDHRDFARPLAFLHLSEDDYLEKSENRLRASDWARLFEDAGFEILENNRLVIEANGRSRWIDHLADITSGVTEDQRKTFDDRFKNLDLADLSTLAVQMLLRRR